MSLVDLPSKPPRHYPTAAAKCADLVVHVVGLTLALLIPLPRVHFDYNLLNMQSDGLRSVVYEKKLLQSANKSLLFGAFVWFDGHDPSEAWALLFMGAFGDAFSLQNTLQRAAPLLLTALCVAIPAQLGLVVIGGEGALVLGGLGAAAVALPLLGLPAPIVLLAMAIAGAVAGALCIGLVGVLRHYRGVNETISSLLVAYIAIAVMNQMVEGPLRDPASLNKPSTKPLADNFLLPAMPGLDVHYGLLLGLQCLFFYWGNLKAETDLESARRQSDQLLLNILPEPIADELKKHGAVAPVEHDSVTVVFTDFVGFTASSETRAPADLLRDLEGVFDLPQDLRLADDHRVQARRHLEEVLHGAVVVTDVEVRRELLARHSGGLREGLGDVDDRTLDRYRKLVAARAQRIPLQHLTGVAAFGPLLPAATRRPRGCRARSARGRPGWRGSAVAALGRSRIRGEGLSPDFLPLAAKRWTVTAATATNETSSKARANRPFLDRGGREAASTLGMPGSPGKIGRAHV